MPTTSRTRRLLAAPILAALAAAPLSAADAAVSRRAVNAAGYEIELDALPSPHPRPLEAEEAAAAGDEAAQTLYVKVGIPWAVVEKSPGQYDWSVVDEIVLSHAGAGYAVVLNPHGDSPLYGALAGRDQASLDAWSAFLRALAERYREQAEFYMPGRGMQELPARDGAYVLKISSVMIQSADPGARIALDGLDASRPDTASWLEALYGEGIGAYVDAVAVAGEGDIGAFRARMLLHDPSAQLWRVGRWVEGGPAAGGRLLRAYLQGLEQEAAVSFFRIDFGPDGAPFLLPVLERIRSGFPPTYTPLVESARGIQVTDPMGKPAAVRTLRLFDPDAKKVLIAYDAGEGSPRGAQAVMAIDTLDLAEPVLKDVAAGESSPAGTFQKDEQAGLTRVALPLADYPLLLEYRRFTSPLYGEGERLEVTGRRLPSVEEILARHQAFQASQDARLLNMRADARVDYHFRIGSGSTVDVTVLSSFYLDPNLGAEFEQKEFYVNGVKWRSSRVPEFPLPQPEKVLTLPLDISLDRRYAYRLAGEEALDGYDCWIVDFEPVEPAGRLYKGRVWIDKRTHARVQISSLQTGLTPPIISNDEKDSYRPIRGPDGLEYWLLARIDGQQVFSATGRNLIMVREVTLSDHVVNDSAFEELHRLAYASDHQILRDTPAGQRYLERTPEGGRVVKDELDRDNLFLLGGVFHNRSLEFPLPLAGVNYFNRDLAGKGIQTNVFFGGVLLFANASHPDLFHAGIDGSVDLTVLGFSSTDTPVRDGREREEENVDLTSQSLTLGLGFPFADYWKLKLAADLSFHGFARDEETDPDRLGFVVPKDTYVGTVGLQGEFNRDAWSVIASISASGRDTWERWGFPDPNLPDETFDEAKGYVRYQGTVAKDFFLPLNQKVHASVSAFGGSDLDRFSQYRFDFFGNRLRGFSGTGIRYTGGAKGQLQYAFNLGEIIRFDATIDHARVKDRRALDDGDELMSFTGVGLSGQTILGPNLIVSLDWGLAVASDVDKFEGDQEILLTILRLFR